MTTPACARASGGWGLADRALYHHGCYRALVGVSLSRVAYYHGYTQSPIEHPHPVLGASASHLALVPASAVRP